MPTSFHYFAGRGSAAPVLSCRRRAAATREDAIDAYNVVISDLFLMSDAARLSPISCRYARLRVRSVLQRMTL